MTSMNPLITIIGPSGVGKTALMRALCAAQTFATGVEQHIERPFQTLFKQDKRYALANQIDYLLLRIEQERDLRGSNSIALMDGGLDLDFHGFTRLFRDQGMLSGAEYDLCARIYSLARETFPPPDQIIRLSAPQSVIEKRLASRERINIASAQDAEKLERYMDEWLMEIDPRRIIKIDASQHDPSYRIIVPELLRKINTLEK
jgi:deoxyadenosine/deoxycytidine kinase